MNRDEEIRMCLLFGLEFPNELRPLTEDEITRAAAGIPFEDGELDERLKEAGA